MVFQTHGTLIMGNGKMIFNQLKLDKQHPYPLYRQLSDQLQEIIKCGEMAENCPLPPERELSRELQINHLTVRKALSILETDGVIYKIRGKGRFVRNRGEMSENLKSEITGRVIGIISSEILEDSNIGLVINGAVDYLHRRAFRVVRISVSDRDDELVRLTANSKLLSGVIFCDQNSRKRRLESIHLARSKNLLIAMVDQNDQLENIDQVTYNEKQGIHDALQFYYDNGHREIAFFNSITDPDNPYPRKVAYQEFIEKHSLTSYLIEYRLTAEKNHTLSAHEQTIRQLKKDSLPKAIIANNDAGAIGIYSALRESGVSVGQDIELIGFGNTFDDSPYLSAQGYPISSIEIPKRKLGAKAAELLLKKMSHPSLPTKKVSLPTKLVHRGSTNIKVRTERSTSNVQH